MNVNAYIVDFLESRYLRHGVAALLVVCAGLILWSMFPHHAKVLPNVTQAVTVQARPKIGSTAEKIATAHLFGNSDTDAANMAPAVTAVQISIEGLFYSTDMDMARAILDVGGKSGVFKTGDTLPDGEKLAAIGMNAVQIANGPALHEVELPQTFGNASSGIRLEGMPDLYAQQDSFPGSRPLGSTAAPVVQRLHPVAIPQGNDPLSQLRSLREQLIKH
jgi:hypothetical protein